MLIMVSCRGSGSVDDVVADGSAVRMLLKQGYRHVYVSRPFALKHGLIPKSVSRPNVNRENPTHRIPPILPLARTVLNGHLRLRRPRQPRSNPHHRRLENRFPPGHAERGDEFRLCPRQELDGEDGYQVSHLADFVGIGEVADVLCVGLIRWIRRRLCIWIPGSVSRVMWLCSRMRMGR